MKAGREQRVLLSAHALAIVEEMSERGTEDYVFPGGIDGKPLSNMAMTEVLRRMGRADIAWLPSTFRDWAAERTNFPNEVVEMALAHAVADKVEAAYRRGDLFEKRRRLMAEWATFCNTTKSAARGKVVALRSLSADR